MGSNKEYSNMEMITEWFEWMTNKNSKLGKLTCKSPNLSKEKAFSVLYTLQEFLEIVSKKIEMCKDCKELFDLSNGEGDNADRMDYKEKGLQRKPRSYEEGVYCEDCLRNRFGFK